MSPAADIFKIKQQFIKCQVSFMAKKKHSEKSLTLQLWWICCVDHLLDPDWLFYSVMTLLAPLNLSCNLFPRQWTMKVTLLRSLVGIPNYPWLTILIYGRVYLGTQSQDQYILLIFGMPRIFEEEKIRTLCRCSIKVPKILEIIFFF